MKISRFLRYIYLKLFRINDSPGRVAFGLGIGVFFGVMPGMGPIAALFFAFLLRANRAAALLGSVLTNTWLSVPTFLVSIKAGSIITGTDYRYLHDQWHLFQTDFRWASLFKISAYRLLFPVLAGYIVVSFVIGVIVYAAARLALRRRKRVTGNGVRVTGNGKK